MKKSLLLYFILFCNIFLFSQEKIVPTLLEGIWENNTRYIVFDTNYIKENKSIPQIVLKIYYQWYDDRAAEAREYTERNCPSSMGDGITVLDSMVFVDNEETGVWGIYYTVFLDDAQKQELKQKKDELVALNLKFVKNSPIFIRQKEAGVNFVFVYNDAVTKKKIMECKYTEKDYK